MILRMAVRNLFSSGLKTWLNVLALSLSFVVIIVAQGFYSGLNRQIEKSTIDLYYGGGQYWVDTYDPYDPITIDDAHHDIPAELREMINQDQASPILIRSATIYPNGRMQNVLLKGIPQEQKILKLPTKILGGKHDAIPALIGNRMAEDTGLVKGDLVTVRWRDNNGTFDATELEIKEIMRTSVGEVDTGQIWIPYEDLTQITDLDNQASIIVLGQNEEFHNGLTSWSFQDLDSLLKDARTFIAADNTGAGIFYVILLMLAMLSIFDTQVLSIFRRKKEFGTLMAMGMTKQSLIQLITLEGAMYSLLAMIVASIYGTPLLAYLKNTGFGMPESMDEFGYALGNRIYPNFTSGLILTTIIFIVIITTLVGYLPTRRISKLSPTEALRKN